MSRYSQTSDRSSLSWVVFRDSDVSEARTMLKDMGSSEGTVDTLGFGGVLETVSELLFPATSTLHSKIRYQIFLPVIAYALYKHRGIHNAREELKRLQLDLQKKLAVNETYGVIGRTRGEFLKYWPAVIYWNSLNTLQIFGEDGIDRSDFCDIVEARHRDRQVYNNDGELEDGDELPTVEFDDEIAAMAACFFRDMGRPRFPEDVNFRLTVQESRFFRDKLEKRFDASLSHALLHRDKQYLRREDLSLFRLRGTGGKDLAELIKQAEAFSRLAGGATYAYRWALSGVREKTEGIEHNRIHFVKWHAKAASLKGWEYSKLDQAIKAFGVEANQKKLAQFCADFLKVVFCGDSSDACLEKLGDLIREREYLIKSNRSRFEDTEVSVPLNVWQEQKHGDHLFNFRWGVGIENVRYIAQAVAG